MAWTRPRFLHPSVVPGGRSASAHLFVSSGEGTAPAQQKTRSGVLPGPAGAVWVNAFFWKILVTRVNGKIRDASGFIRLARHPLPVMRGLDPRIHLPLQKIFVKVDGLPGQARQ
jgi:hypothetical protein